ncbi:hypothetical protein K501DRAFT_336126 [Backusella circina FSU 941]|nr:hypothetical protein K501DRAFT_336126 [Backusella circina FSU 941]
MPYKSSEWKSQESKKKKSSGVKSNKSVGDDKKSVDPTISTTSNQKKEQPEIGSKPVEMEQREAPPQKKSKIRRTVTLCRRLLAWSMITWLGYYTFFVCGNPHGPKNLPLQSDMCSAIETAKLDFLSLFETDFYKAHVDPVVLPIKNRVEEVYLHHGQPAQAKVASIYRKHGRHHVDQLQRSAQQVFKHQVQPAVKQFHAGVVNHPYSKQAVKKVNDAYQHEHVQLVLQKTHQAYYHPTVQRTIKKVKTWTEPASIKAGWDTTVKTCHRIVKEIDDRLPPSAIKIKNQIKECIHYAENTEMKVFLTRVYWAYVDLYQMKVVPFLKSNRQVRRARVYYKKNIEGFVTYNIKPAMRSLNERWHLDQVYDKIVSYLPSR